MSNLSNSNSYIFGSGFASSSLPDTKIPSNQSRKGNISQSIGHVSSALIPNCISILFNSNTRNITLDDIIKEQLTILGITYYYKLDNKYLTNTLDLIKYANDKKLSLCVYNNNNFGICNEKEAEIIHYLLTSQHNHMVYL
jgi:hypothetical protein